MVLAVSWLFMVRYLASGRFRSLYPVGERSAWDLFVHVIGAFNLLVLFGCFGFNV